MQRSGILIRKRMLLLVMIFVFLNLTLVARLVSVCVIDSSALTARGVAQWTRKGIVTAGRGNITDRNGHVLAISATAFVVTANPRVIADDAAFAEALSPVLMVDEEVIRKRIADKTKASVILKRQVPRDVVDAIRALRQEQFDKGVKVLRGVSFEEDARRVYPLGTALCQVLGLTNVDSVGQSGLEKQYESVLRGVDGEYRTEVDASARTLPDGETLYIPPKTGNTLVLTIDSVLQSICEKAMRECLAVNEAKAVSCIMMNVRTGDILAMCMKPDYDPNSPPRNELETLTQLMRITLVSDVYEPGSTFKILTTAAALDAGVTFPEDRFHCSARVTVDGDVIKCWGRAHGAESMAEGLCNSCNPVFVELALRLGTERFYRYLSAFGLGKYSGVELPGETAGIMIPLSAIKNVDLARVGFGQSIAVTPLQLITAASAAVNGGRLLKPHIVKAVETPEGETIYESMVEVTANPISAETSATMRGLLELVVENGGGKNARVSGYRIGGKTGTAQFYRDGRVVTDTHVGSFIGFAPADEPVLALLVIVSEAQVPIDYGSATAAPFAGQIFAEALESMGFPKEGETLPDVEVPQLAGLSLSAAKRELSLLTLTAQTDGVGDTVLSQLPPSGSVLKRGGEVMLYTQREGEITPETLLAVPDVKGMTMTEAGRAIRTKGLSMTPLGSGLASHQTPAAGSYVAPDTDIIVTFSIP
ncbi:MAG: penicillin-binding transpeptidase domain-containing protein [Eubacteriales bacterium]|nr:penicillin-binding transpeptidase domain-containing protein [Eubacteriales bacterium]MDD3880825.1 penicillin-binding transpeptidase domain-containing protein [Eubacteriales bacterium]MDD4511808.1 penicillin-binding transpeptidase domain-containing protein [Eubacteriales bacterium]